ncbi:MAG: bifunctional riboflavin kinase/FAD synthetase [Neisseria sp.]|nr:bifunctional riboflavin kinase/FAD synthetase [Neisseria sp.]
MQIYPGQSFIPHFPHGSALTIGNFDGVHCGHLRILQRLRAEADARGLPTVLMLFEPQPAEYFARIHGRETPYRLSPLRDKLRLLESSGCLNAVWVARFNEAFAAVDAETFIRRILMEQLNVKYLLIGDDFRFGAQRGGDVALLQAQSAFVTEQVSSILAAGNRASSTAVREALSMGNLAMAAQILGHDYCLSGRVMHGRKWGRKIGCPTANIYLPPHRYPLSGVFVVEVTGAFGTKRGVASFGLNPTVSATTRQKLEVHLFELNQDLYGQRLSICFKHKLRDELKFDNLDALREQIFRDMDAARAWGT